MRVASAIPDRDKESRQGIATRRNFLLAIAAIAATAAGISAIIKKSGYYGLIFVAAYLALVFVFHKKMKNKKSLNTGSAS